MKAFAETARSDLLEQQSQGEGGIYDEFNAPPITSGVGRTEAEFFVDGNHSRVSSLGLNCYSESSQREKYEKVQNGSSNEVIIFCTVIGECLHKCLQ